MPTSEKNRSLLWLENDEDSFDIARLKLEGDGFLVDFVTNTDDFESMLLENSYDLIIVDIRGESFNGLHVVSSSVFNFGSAKLCILSGFLNDPAVKEFLSGLDRTIFLLEKSYPFNQESLVEVGLESQLKRIALGLPVHTNKTFYSLADESHFSVDDGITTYEKYCQLNPSEKSFVKSALLELAEPEISRLAREGYKSFLVAGPKGQILKKSKSHLSMSSDDISNISAAQGFPCVLQSRVVRVEEFRTPQCKGMYEYYFSVTVSFSGKEDNLHQLHFDSGSEASWFDLNFLKDCGIGLTGDANNSAVLQTVNGREEVFYYSETREIAVYNQENSEEFELTDLLIRGIAEWEKIPISGFTDHPEDKLCEKCAPLGRCLARVGLLGQDLILNPKPFTLVLDGKTKKTKFLPTE